MGHNKERSSLYYKNNKKKADAAAAKWRREHPEKYRQQYKKWNAANPEKRAAYIRKSRYGLTVEKYNDMLVEQNGNCAICQAHCKLVVDHDHVTKKVRGLLCNLCNRSLGSFKESQDILLRAIKYLRQYDAA